MTVRKHYEDHLAAFYSWMTGDFEERVSEQESYFRKNRIFPAGNKIAVDLGSGHGIHTVALARSGFHVHAIDFNRQLLTELESRSNNLPVTLHYSDMLEFQKHLNAKAEIIVCMGDTLAHLENQGQLEDLFGKVRESLKENGKFIVSFRDYRIELKDTERFIPVRSDESRILTCVLEFESGRVKVTDLLFENTENGWQQKISSYYKLRLSPDLVEDLLIKASFRIVSKEFINRMIYLVCE
jgi:SAM-dependent methyltransferase